MYKYIVCALAGLLMSWNALGQVTFVDSILLQVERNNLELKALWEQNKSSKVNLRSENNLPDPEFGFYYLPFGEHSTGDYSEFQLSQTMEFPSVYLSRGKLIDLKSVQLDLDYQGKRQEILSKAKELCFKLVYLQKRHELENRRSQQARQVYEQSEELFRKEQVGILELNKAKLVWMQEQFKIKQLEAEQKAGLNKLAKLNGGLEIQFDNSDYPFSKEMAPRDSLWQEKLEADPHLLQLQKQEQIAAQALSLAGQQYLPNITAGYNSQGVAGERFSGLYAGISIPLWSNRYKLQSARSNQAYQESLSQSFSLSAWTDFDKTYANYQLLWAQFQDYEKTLAALNGEDLLFEAYRLGELSFLDYYRELQFYREAYDAMLEMEYQLYISQSELLKHQL